MSKYKSNEDPDFLYGGVLIQFGLSTHSLRCWTLWVMCFCSKCAGDGGSLGVVGPGMVRGLLEASPLNVGTLGVIPGNGSPFGSSGKTRCLRLRRKKTAAGILV